MDSSGASGDSVRVVPAPFTEKTLRSALDELSDGARLAVQTCLDLWKDEVSRTDSSSHIRTDRTDLTACFGRNSEQTSLYHS